MPSATASGSRRTVVTVRGIVEDVEGRPLGAATIAQVSGRAHTRTALDGRFALRLTVAGPVSTVRLSVQRQGYRVAVVEARVDGTDDPAPLSVHLAPLATALDRVVVNGGVDRPLRTSMTRQEVTRAPALVEPDAYRQLTLLPSVMQTSASVARLHLAGAALDEALYTLDGHPLQSPTHVRGMGAGINYAALDRVEVLSHHLPATVDGRLGGVIAMHSRRGDGARGGEALASSFSLTAAHVERDVFGAEVVVAGRTSYLNSGLSGIQGDWLDERYPLNDFRDGLLRIGRDFAGWRAEAIGFLSSDLHLADHEPSDPFRGEYLIGLTLSHGDSSAVRTTIRASRNLATRASGWFDDAEQGDLRSRQVLATVSIDQERRLDERTSAALRVAFTHRRNAHRWDDPLRFVDRELVSSYGKPYRYDGATSLTRISVGGSASRVLDRRLTAEIGLAFDGTEAGAFAAPRARLAWRPAAALAFDLSLERRHQFDGELSPEIVADLAAPVFLFDRPRRMEGAAISGAWRHTVARWSIVVNGDLYARRISDRPVAATYWSTAWLDTVHFDRVSARAIGAGLAASLEGPRGAAVALAYGRSRTTERDPDRWVRSSWDRPHSLSVVGTTPRILGFSLGAALRNVSGLPATPVLGLSVRPTLYPQSPVPHIITRERNSGAMPATTRLDLSLRRAWRFGRLEGDLQAQIFNATGERIPMTMTWDWGGRPDGQLDYAIGWSEVERFSSFGFSLRW